MASVQSQIQRLYGKNVFSGKIPFSEIEICDDIILAGRENVSERTIERAIGYLMCLGFSKNEEEKLSVFEEPFIRSLYINGLDAAKKLYCEALAGTESRILAALKLAAFSEAPDSVTPAYEADVFPNENTLLDINKMLRRCCDFFSGEKRVIKHNFDFEGAYNGKVSSGKGDYLTKDGIWSISISSSSPAEYDFVLLAAYYTLGQHCHNAAKFRKVKTLGILNPILGKVYSISVSDMPKDITAVLERELF